MAIIGSLTVSESRKAQSQQQNIRCTYWHPAQIHPIQWRHQNSAYAAYNITWSHSDKPEGSQQPAVSGTWECIRYSLSTCAWASHVFIVRGARLTARATSNYIYRNRALPIINQPAWLHTKGGQGRLLLSATSTHHQLLLIFYATVFPLNCCSLGIV